MLESRGIASATVKEKLTIIEGNAKDGSAVGKTLLDESGRIIDQIVFGIGLFPLLAAAKIWLMTMLRRDSEIHAQSSAAHLGRSRGLPDSYGDCDIQSRKHLFSDGPG